MATAESSADRSHLKFVFSSPGNTFSGIIFPVCLKQKKCRVEEEQLWWEKERVIYSRQ